MIEYKLKHMDNSPVTLDEIDDVNTAIETIFTEGERGNIGSKIRITYCVNDHSLAIYYGEKGSRIGIPLRYQKEIKKTFKNLAQLKLVKN